MKLQLRAGRNDWSLFGVRLHFAVVLAVVIVFASMVVFRQAIERVFPMKPPRSAPSARAPSPSVRLVPGSRHTLQVDSDVASKTGIRTEVAGESHITQDLVLSGTLALDASCLEEVRSRFAGEVTEVSKASDGVRTIMAGDVVVKDQLLAVVWSRELGEKKSELVDAVSQLNLASETLASLEKSYRDGAVPELRYREAQRAMEADRIAVSRLVHTLQTWRVPDAEIKEVEDRARELTRGEGRAIDEDIHRWARVEIRSAMGGVVLERNLALGDLVSPSDDLFKVADLSRLRVLAYAYEEDLPRLDALSENMRQWSVSIPAAPGLSAQQGKFEQIGHVIEPTQHTALVMGWVSNASGRLRAGQFATAHIALPSPGNEVAVPASSVIERGGEKLIFVQVGTGCVFARRRVAVSRQVGNVVCVRSDVSADEASQGIAPLRPGERVVVAGAVLLQQSLTDLTASEGSSSASSKH